MKKLLIGLMVILSLVFTGCSCSPVVTLSFSNAWIDGDYNQPGTKEVLTYQVDFVEDLIIGDYSFKSEIKDGDFTYSIGTGSYVSEIQLISATSSLLDGYQSDILDEIVSGTGRKILLYQKTRLEIPFTYQRGDSAPQTNNDFVETHTYFLENGNAFAPILSTQESKMSIVSIVSSSLNVVVQHMKTSTVYNKNNLSSSVKVFAVESTGSYVEGDLMYQDDFNRDYSFKTVIDNSSLLFALRSMAFNNANSSSVSVFATQYGGPRSLTIAYEKNNNTVDDFNVNLNGTAMPKEEIQLACHSFVLNSSEGCQGNTNTGRKQLAYINTPKEDGSIYASIGSNRSIVMKYVEPLIEYGGYKTLGALVYKLNSISITK